MTKKGSSVARKLWRKVSSFKLPSWVLGVALMLIAIFFLGGGFYCIVERPPLIIVLESVFVMIAYGIAALGLIMIERAARIFMKRSTAWMLLIVGVTLVVIAVVLLHHRWMHRFTR